jgi:hypothetical protein
VVVEGHQITRQIKTCTVGTSAFCPTIAPNFARAADLAAHVVCVRSNAHVYDAIKHVFRVRCAVEAMLRCRCRDVEVD